MVNNLSSEEKQILDYFGVHQLEGNVRGEHFSKILTFLRIHSGKSWRFFKNVSPPIIGMQFRYILENYVNALIELGIIVLYNQKNEIYFNWVGIKAVNDEILLPITPQQKIKETVKEINKLKKMKVKKEKNQEEIKEKEKDLCPNCNKVLDEGQKYCNTQCLREYLENKKGEK